MVPIAQAESDRPLVPINYSQECGHSSSSRPAQRTHADQTELPHHLTDISAMSTFRYILSQQELSVRVLELTGEIVKMNPAHYTVW